MNHLFVPYELAVKLKEKGFNELCFALITKREELFPQNISDKKELKLKMQVTKINFIECVPCPIWQQAVNWLEDKHGFFFERMFEDVSKEETFMLWTNGDLGKNHTFKSLEKMIEEALKQI